MSKLGDVVFCADCDRNAELYRSAGGAENGTAPISPRRMAVKKDANGDRLCTPCLDLRRANRNAAFLLHDGRAPIPSPRPTGLLDATNGEASAPPRIVRIASAVRIARPPRPAVAEQAAIAEPVARAQRASRKAAIVRTRPLAAKVKDVIVRAKPAERKAKGRTQERAFGQLVAEIGFLRARLLLGELKQKLRSRLHAGR